MEWSMSLIWRSKQRINKQRNIIAHKTMGSFFSSDAYDATAPSDVCPMTRIHSSASWKSIFDAHKDSNRLVNPYISIPTFSSFLCAWCMHVNSNLLIFQELLHKHQMVVDFSAAWCGPCRMIEPAIIQMPKKFTDVNFVMIDVDELRVIFHFHIYSFFS